MMKDSSMLGRLFLAWLLVGAGDLAGTLAAKEEPLSVFIRAGEKTHGAGEHDHPRFLREWTDLLNERGAEPTGALRFPTASELEKAEVLVMYAANAGDIEPDDREYLQDFLDRGSGMAVIHDAVCGHSPQWFKTLIGGAWEHGHSKWYEGEVGMYFQNRDHPIFVGITAELAGGSSIPRARADASADESTGPSSGSDAIDTLIVGGGSAHDFDRWFHEEDTEILETGGLADVTYTDDVSEILPKLDGIDVLYLSNNQPMEDPDLRKGIFEFVNQGGGLLLVHAAVWYNWPDWPEYNKLLAGGGSRGHDPLGEFTVEVTKPSHPILKGVSGEFRITDELYYFRPDPEGSPIEVLATAKSKNKSETFPIIWTVEHPEGRIAATSLGHDGRAHHHPAYRTLLRNALKWVTPDNAEPSNQR